MDFIMKYTEKRALQYAISENFMKWKGHELYRIGY